MRILFVLYLKINCILVYLKITYIFTNWKNIFLSNIEEIL